MNSSEFASEISLTVQGLTYTFSRITEFWELLFQQNSRDYVNNNLFLVLFFCSFLSTSRLSSVFFNTVFCFSSLSLHSSVFLLHNNFSSITPVFIFCIPLLPTLLIFLLLLFILFLSKLVVCYCVRNKTLCIICGKAYRPVHVRA